MRGRILSQLRGSYEQSLCTCKTAFRLPPAAALRQPARIFERAWRDALGQFQTVVSYVFNIRNARLSKDPSSPNLAIEV